MSAVTATILSEGKVISSTIELMSLDILRELNRIPFATLEILDGDAAAREFPVSDLAAFEPGMNIEIKLRYEGQPDNTVFRGSVVSQKVEARSDRTMLTVELKDQSVRLSKTRHSMVFRDKSDSDVFKDMFRSAGLKTGQIESTQPKHKVLVQYDSTDWDFLLCRADVYGLVVLAEDGKISVEKLKPPSSAKHSLEWGIDEILELEFEADAESQITQLDSAAWQIKEQKLTPPAKAIEVNVPQGNLKGSKIAKELGFTEATMKHVAAIDPKEQQAWADGRLLRSRWSMIRGRISTPGSAEFKPLETIEVKGVGKRFNGRSVITGVRHRLDADGWCTDLQLGISASPFCNEEHIQQAPAAGLLPAVSGLQIGIVDKFEDDPDREFRVKVILPAIDEKKGSVWARLASPDAGNERGFVFLPETGDEVVVGFFNNDPRHPVILGSMFSSKNAAPKGYAKPNEKNQNKGLVTKGGTTIGFVDGDKASVFVETKNKNKLLFDDGSEAIQITDQHGNKITMDKNGVELRSAKDLQLEASGNVAIKGSKVDIK